MDNQNTHKDLIQGIGVQEFSKYLKVKENTVYQWVFRNRIPPRYWVKAAYLANKKGFKVTVKKLEKTYDKNG